MPPLLGESRVFKDGGQTRDRTEDTSIFSAVLYQLSYLAPSKGDILEVQQALSTPRGNFFNLRGRGVPGFIWPAGVPFLDATRPAC